MPEIEPAEFARIREQCDLSLYEVARLLNCDRITWHHQESGRRRDRRFGALARAVPWLVRGDLPPWCLQGAKLATKPRLLAVHARDCLRCGDTLQAAAQVLYGWHGRRPNIRLQQGEKLRPLKPWWKKSRRSYPRTLLPCTICKQPRLSNRSGVCQKCRRALKDQTKQREKPHVWDWRSKDVMTQKAF
jgi:hypothetical protein